nr:MAG TPA: Kinocilin protein [Crassvirales sp.]
MRNHYRLICLNIYNFISVIPFIKNWFNFNTLIIVTSRKFLSNNNFCIFSFLYISCTDCNFGLNFTTIVKSYSSI